jgi:hypothetical protein
MDSSDQRALPPSVQAALRKYFLITGGPEGEKWRTTEVSQTGPNEAPLGMGPVLDKAVIDRFLEVDTTPNKEWFDWMLFQAGGGRVAMKRGETLFSQTKIRFIEDRIRGYRNKKNGKVYPPVPEKEAAAQWARVEENFRHTLTVGDQDLVSSHDIFGFFRHWPGRNRIYERVALAVKEFLKLTKKTLQMNKFLRAEGNDDRLVSLKPKSYDSITDLEAASKRVVQFFASKAARSDIRVASGPNGEKTIYSDDYVTVRVPLTYAAAVKYGWPAWAWADKESFERGLEGGVSAWQDPWRKHTGNDKKLFVYIEFNVPMPAWVTFSHDKFSRHTLHNLALVIPHDELKNFNPDTIPMYDEENNENVTLGHIKQRIRDEARRGNYDPEEEEYPLKRGPSVFANEGEAEEVVRHLDAALDAIKSWAARFDPSSVVSDYLGTAND